jgi:amino acid transporter
MNHHEEWALLKVILAALVLWALIEFAAAIQYQYCRKGRNKRYKRLIIGWWILLSVLIAVSLYMLIRSTTRVQ